MLPAFSTECLHLTYRPDLHQLTGRWLRSVSEEELHAGYEALRRAALHHGCHYWLIDSRRRITRSLNGPEWVTTQLLPQVQRELGGGTLCVCFVVLPDYLHAMSQAYPAAPLASTAAGPVQFARFLDEGAANAWLAARQAASLTDPPTPPQQ